MNISAGGIIPQGNYVQYTDQGFTGNLRFNFRIQKAGFLSGWFDLNGSFFSSDESYVEIIDDPYYSGADQSISEYAFFIASNGCRDIILSCLCLL